MKSVNINPIIIRYLKFTNLLRLINKIVHTIATIPDRPLLKLKRSTDRIPNEKLLLKIIMKVDQ